MHTLALSDRRSQRPAGRCACNHNFQLAYCVKTSDDSAFATLMCLDTNAPIFALPRMFSRVASVTARHKPTQLTHDSTNGTAMSFYDTNAMLRGLYRDTSSPFC